MNTEIRYGERWFRVSYVEERDGRLRTPVAGAVQFFDSDGNEHPVDTDTAEIVRERFYDASTPYCEECFSSTCNGCDGEGVSEHDRLENCFGDCMRGVCVCCSRDGEEALVRGVRAERQGESNG